MAGEFSPITKDVACRKKIFVELIYFIKANLTTSFFLKFSGRFLKNNIKYVVSRVVSGTLSGALKTATMEDMTIQNAF